MLCRAGRLYRATSDVDTIVDDAAVVARMRAQPSTTTTTNGFALDGTIIDIIAVGTIDDAEQLPDDPGDRLFVLSHRFAFDTAEPVVIEIVEPTDRRVVARAEVAMATPAALVAMKLQSYPKRRGPSIAKQGSDLEDIHALLVRCGEDPELSGPLAAAPFAMGALCVDAIQMLLIDDADIAAGRVRRYTSGAVNAAELRSRSEALVRSITQATPDP